MNRKKVHIIVEYIKMKDEFPFNTEDVAEDVFQVLAHYGIAEQFDQDELALLRGELTALALREQETEIVRLTERTS